jgi:acetyl esterase/lipase
MLALGALGTVFALNALRPRHRPGWAAFLSFLAGWLTAEFALHHLAWQAGLAFWLWQAGALETQPGRVGLGLLGLSWLGLGLLAAEGLGALGLMRAGLRGVGWARGLASPPARAWLLPWPRRPASLEKLRSLVFSREGGVELGLDVVRDRRSGRARPVLVYFHGGGWVIGDKGQQGLLLAHRLAADGWLCVNANYRLAPAVRLPAQVLDCQRALAWVRAHAAELGGDPGRVLLSGGSAGGHLAALLALTGTGPGGPGWDGGPRPEELVGADLRVQGCLPLFGIYDLWDEERVYPNGALRKLMERHVLRRPAAEAEPLYRALSPLDRVPERVGPDAPAWLLLHGTRDSLAPLAGARRFQAALSRAGAECTLLEVPGAQHAFELLPSPRALAALEAAAAFARDLAARPRA